MGSLYLEHWQPNISVLIEIVEINTLGQAIIIHTSYDNCPSIKSHQAVIKFSYRIIHSFPSRWEINKVKSVTLDTVLWEETGEASNTSTKFSLVSELFRNF